MDGEGCYGKAMRGRRQRTPARGAAATPYSRPVPSPAIRRETDDATVLSRGLEEEPAAPPTRSSLLGSVFTAAATPFRAAAGLLGKVGGALCMG